jgi:hypothetical protein
MRISAVLAWVGLVVAAGLPAGAAAVESAAVPAVAVAPASLQQQGQGQGRGQERARQQGQADQRQPAQAQQRGQGNQRQPAQAQQRGQGAPGRADSAPGQARRAGRPAAVELNRHVSALPVELRTWTRSSRRHERMLAGAAVHGAAFGLEPARLVWGRQGDYVVLANPRGDVLLHIDDRRARELGFWEVRRLGDYRPRANAPAFCRSGAGHPVWGRQWCLDRGFGIGSRHGTIWSRAPVQDVIFRRGYYDRDRLAREVLIGVIGDVVFNRLAVHALSMGMHDPLYGTWVAAPDPGAPRIMHVYSGDVVVAEFVDTNRNDRADVIWILQPL